MTFRRTPHESIALAKEKLLEADYFGVLLRYVTSTHVGILPIAGLEEVDIFPGGSRPHRQRPVEEQLSYLLSAYLNACYSTIEYLKREPTFQDQCRRFLHQHRASGPDGGLRTRTVHFKLVKPGYKGHLTERTPDGVHRLVKMLRRLKVPIRDVASSEAEIAQRTRYYIDDTEPQDDVAWLAAVHYSKLQELIQECAAIPVESPLGLGDKDA